MQREQLADLAVFVAVAQERRFTRAAAKLGITQSSLSQTIRRLESHLGLRLLARTMRSVAPDYWKRFRLWSTHRRLSLEPRPTARPISRPIF